MIFVTPDTRHIVAPWRADLATLIPHAKPFEHKGVKHMLFPNAHDEAKLARNLGIPVPSPILTRYTWPGRDTPWDIQKFTSALLTESRRCFVLSSMGTGKSRSVVYALDYLMTVGIVKRALIVAPLSTLTPVWENELFQVVPSRNVVTLYGSADKRRELLRRGAEFFIINHHGLSVIGPELKAMGFDAIVIDELAVFRNKATRLWKAADEIVSLSTTAFAWGLTGSPTPTAPTDAWAQVKLLAPGNVSRTFKVFQDQTMRKLTTFRWLPRPNATEIVHAAMQPSVRFTLDDVMELPETVYVNREVKLDPDAAKAYKLLYDKMRMLTSGGESITAVNEGILQSKLLQVACGYIYTDKKQVYELPSTERLATLDEVISETDRKVIVFVPYVHALKGVAEHLRKAGRKVGVVYGETTRAKRDLIFRGFQHGATPDTLVAHPQTMAHGLTLTAAATIVWYAPTQSLEIYEQANARIARPGQTSKTLIAHIYATRVEKLTYERLRSRGKMQSLLLELFHSQENDY